MKFRHFLALALAAFLTSSNSLPARLTVLGVVARANRAHLRTTVVTAGATVYDGDRYSTETRGTLSLRDGTTALQLAEASVMTVRSTANGAPGIEAQLEQGTLLFSATRSSNLEVMACGALVRPGKDGQTFAQISVTGPKELRIYARRGELQFSYRGETETITEGMAYRVILDPAKSQYNKEDDSESRQKKFLLIAIRGEAGVVFGLVLRELLESPDRP